jgi:CheY-like chemotaxis protein
MNKIKILIAEDVKEARDILREKLNDYLKTKYNQDSFTIESSSSYQEALRIINESEKNSEYYNIFFCDIDFTEDKKGGQRDSGYELINRMFEVCPITCICTHSGQFRGKDLWPKYEELKGKGLILITMDKSHSEGGGDEWFKKNFDIIFNEYDKNKYLWNIWENHKNIIDKFKSIKDNLDSILVLLRNKDKFDEKDNTYRNIIHLYHISLEKYCRGSLTDKEIIKRSNENKEEVEKLIDRQIKFQDDNVTTKRIIVAYSKEKVSHFGYKLNYYRNQSIHPKNFKPRFENILFANLTLSAYILKKEEISYKSFESYYLNEIEEATSDQKKAKSDLKMIIDFIKQP